MAHAQIEVRVPADKDAVETPRPVWLKVEDAKGSYTIPYIQSSTRLRVTPTFASEQVVEAEVGLVGGDGVRREGKTATKSGDVIEFTGLPPGEYTLEVTGRDAAGNVVARDRHGPVGIGTVIAALGDSITEGYHSRGFRQESLELTPAMFPAEVVSRDRRNYPQFAPTTAHHRPDINCFTSWMPRLNDLLAKKWRRPVFIANEGWGGITTGRYLQMMKTDAGWQRRMRQLEPSVWLIHLGVNDGRAKLGADEVTRNLAAIVDILVKDHAATPARIFIASPSYDYAPEAADRLAEYRKAIAELVAEKKLKSGPDFFTAYAKDRPRYYGTDPVHPNAEGMELMAQLWAEVLPAALPEAAESSRHSDLAKLVDGPVTPHEVVGGFAFTEGPAADAAGDVFFTDIPNQRIHVWRAATGKVELWLDNTDKANGLFFAADGTLYACQMGTGRRVVAIDPATKQVTGVAERIDGKRFNAPNDLVLDAAGGIWFTDPAYGRAPEELEIGQEAVYWVSPDRTAVARVADSLRRPNGIAFSPDGKTLYVADRDGDVSYAYPVEGPGRLGPRTTFADTGSDGFAVDEQGNLYVTPKANHVRVFDPAGRMLGEIPLPAAPSNVTFGGPGRKTLFITARDKVYTLPMKVAGGG